MPNLIPPEDGFYWVVVEYNIGTPPNLIVTVTQFADGYWHECGSDQYIEVIRIIEKIEFKSEFPVLS